MGRGPGKAMSESTPDPDKFSDKMETVVADHRRFISEFEKSLASAAHFIELADSSMETEPENTVTMLRQIREIDLVGHIRRLAEEFDGMQSFLIASPMEGETGSFREDLAALADDYETLNEEANSQLDRIDRLIGALDA